LLQEFLTKKVKANLQIHPLIHTRVDFIMAEGGDEILSPEKKTRTLATLGMGWEPVQPLKSGPVSQLHVRLFRFGGAPVFHGAPHRELVKTLPVL
jgi:hypothetical protein